MPIRGSDLRKHIFPRFRVLNLLILYPLTCSHPNPLPSATLPTLTRWLLSPVLKESAWMEEMSNSALAVVLTEVGAVGKQRVNKDMRKHLCLLRGS